MAPGKPAEGAELVVTALSQTWLPAPDAGSWRSMTGPGPNRHGRLAASKMARRLRSTTSSTAFFIADGCRWIVDYKTVLADAGPTRGRAAGARREIPAAARALCRTLSGDPLPLRMAISTSRCRASSPNFSETRAAGIACRGQA